MLPKFKNGKIVLEKCADTIVYTLHFETKAFEAENNF